MCWQCHVQENRVASSQPAMKNTKAEKNSSDQNYRGKRRHNHTDKTREGTRTRATRDSGTRRWGAPRGVGGLPSFSSVWWSLDGFLLPDLHLPSRLKKFSSSSRVYSVPTAPPSDSFTALVNFTCENQSQMEMPEQNANTAPLLNYIGLPIYNCNIDIGVIWFFLNWYYSLSSW